MFQCSYDFRSYPGVGGVKAGSTHDWLDAKSRTNCATLELSELEGRTNGSTLKLLELKGRTEGSIPELVKLEGRTDGSTLALSKPDDKVIAIHLSCGSTRVEPTVLP